MAKEADDAQLKKAFTDHLKETEGHIERLEKAFAMINKTPRGKKCAAIIGIVAEGKEVIEEVDDPQTLDAGLVAAGQAAEHYEIARYGTLIAWAEELGHDDIVRFLSTNLNEEKARQRQAQHCGAAQGRQPEGCELRDRALKCAITLLGCFVFADVLA
jgi:ferritin-like metal-binding protein YciE